MNDFRMKELSEIITDLSVLTGVKCVLYDDDLRPLYHFEGQRCGFCSLIRENGDNFKKCLESDKEGFRLCLESGMSCSYKCHMGLTETVTPIKDGDKVIGYILAGQSVAEEDIPLVKKKTELIPDKKTRESLMSELERVRVLSKGETEAMMRLVLLSAEHIEMKKLIRSRSLPEKEQIDEYILENIKYSLDVATISRALGMSRSSLYAISKDSFGMGITEYVAKVRLDRAAELLRATDLSVSEVAEAVGVCDSNYFIKIFKRRYGTSPKKWKNSLK